MKSWIGTAVILAICTLPHTKGMAQQRFEEPLYKDQVGYLSPENPDASIDFKRCAPDTLPIGFYSSSAPYTFKEDKGSFRRFITSNFNDNHFDDNGLLVLRFIISCNGAIGDVETLELNYDFEPMELSHSLVVQLKELALGEGNWQSPPTKTPLDFYMYLIFRIENGNVVAILP